MVGFCSNRGGEMNKGIEKESERVELGQHKVRVDYKGQRRILKGYNDNLPYMGKFPFCLWEPTSRL